MRRIRNFSDQIVLTYRSNSSLFVRTNRLQNQTSKMFKQIRSNAEQIPNLSEQNKNKLIRQNECLIYPKFVVLKIIFAYKSTTHIVNIVKLTLLINMLFLFFYFL